MGPYVLWTLAWVAALLVAEATERPSLARVAKPAASLGFCAAALASADLTREYDRFVLAALVLSMLGDVLLLSRAPRAFMGGLGAFLLAHVAFGLAFWVHGVAIVVAIAGILLFGLVAWLVWRWLGPHVDGSMRGPVLVYVAVITVMVSLAAGATAAGGSPRMLAGAFAFYLSDLSVARDRFVREELVNRLWGLPLYYGAQLCLAATI